MVLRVRNEIFTSRQLFWILRLFFLLAKIWIYISLKEAVRVDFMQVVNSLDIIITLWAE